MPISPINLTNVLNGIGGFAIVGEAAGDLSGISVSDAGDVNGDGLADLFIGARGADPDGRSNAGKSYVVFGKANGTQVNLSSIASGSGGFVINGELANDSSGQPVSSAGDINGDGLADLLIGAPSADPNGRNNAGKSYVVFGKANGTQVNLSSIASGSGGFVINGALANDSSGGSISSAGDINGDGLDDLIIGLKGVTFRNYVVFGKTNGSAINLDNVANGNGGFVINSQLSRTGQSVSTAGDVNGDGLVDLILGGGDLNSTGRGRSYVVFGRTGGSAINLTDVASGIGGFIIDGEAANDFSGDSVSNAGDVNGDGLDDLIIGASAADPDGKNSAGKSYVVFGKASGTAVNLSNIASGIGGFVINGESAGDSSGWSVSTAGDVNGDGLDDLLIGAPGATISGKSFTGKIYVVFGRSATTAVNLGNIATGVGGFVINGIPAAGASNGGSFGNSVSTAKDVNGDGFADVLIGNFGSSLTNLAVDSQKGISFVVFGGNFTNSVTQLGTAGDNTLTGTSDADVFNGAQGNDTLNGNGGADVLYGGSGNDSLSVSDLTFKRIDGGLGTDTLRLNGSGLTLDLTTLANSKIQGIEQIDLTGTGNNTLTLSVRDLLDLSDTTSTLTVLGNAGDRVNASGFTQSGTQGGLNRYVQENAILLVDPAVTVSTGTSQFSGIINLSDVANGIGGFAISGEAAGDISGTSVGGVGDVNGDGLDDVIIGSPLADPNGRSNAGKSYVVFGKIDNAAVELSQINAGRGGFSINGEVSNSSSGSSVRVTGDVNGDGLNDLIVGSPFADVGSAIRAGRSYVIWGQVGGASIDLSQVASGRGGFVVNGETGYDYSGRSVSGVGDVNGDGLDDLIVGSPFSTSTSNSYAGKSYVVFGKTSGTAINLSQITAGTGGFAINGEAANDVSGFSVSGAGDVNGDGLADLIVGAYGSDPGSKSNAGKSYVVFGKTSGTAINLSQITAGTGGFAINGEAANDFSGFSVNGAGDVNGDGLADLIVGAGNADPNSTVDAGRSYVVFGKTSGTAVNLSEITAGIGGFAINGEAANNFSAVSVGGSGDINGDGLDDLIIGASGADPNGRIDAGKSYVVFGKTSGSAVNLSQVVAGIGGFAINGEAVNDSSGSSVNRAGDINGDGFADVIVAASRMDPVGKIDAGRSYIVFGGNFTQSVSQQGTPGSDTLIGTRNSQSLVGAQGNDQLSDGGFTGLVLYGGAGDDRLSLSNSSFNRLDGGVGVDTLVLTGANLALNLTTLGNTKISGIERIDLTGSGNNSCGRSGG